MGCLVACEAETCINNIDGQCWKIGGIVLDENCKCKYYTPDPFLPPVPWIEKE